MPGEYLGDFPAAGQVIPYFFATYDSNDPTASVTMTGLAVTGIEVYKGTSMTQRASDAGYALIDTDGIDVDTTTGIHGISVDTSDNTDAGFYAAGNDYTVIVNGMTVDAGSVSMVAFRFSIDNRGLLRPTTASRTLDVSSTGEAGLDFSNVNLPAGSIPSLGIVDSGTAQSASGTTIVLRAAAAFADDELIGATVVITGGSTGVGQARIITDYVSSTDTATVDTWTTTPTGTITYIVIGTPPSSSTSPIPANVTQWLGTAAATPTVAGVPEVDLTHVAGATTNVSTLATNVDAILTDTGTTLPASIATAQADLDTLTGSDGVTLATSQPNYAPATAAALATTDTVVDNLNLGIIYGAAATGTLSTTQATSDLTGYADDQLIGRVIIWTSGACEGEATDITDYASASGLLTFTALTTAPANSDTFKIV